MHPLQTEHIPITRLPTLPTLMIMILRGIAQTYGDSLIPPLRGHLPSTRAVIPDWGGKRCGSVSSWRRFRCLGSTNAERPRRHDGSNR